MNVTYMYNRKDSENKHVCTIYYLQQRMVNKHQMQRYQELYKQIEHLHAKNKEQGYMKKYNEPSCCLLSC